MEWITKPTKISTHGYVGLIDLMPHPASGQTPDQAIVSAARASFERSEESVDDFRLIHRLMRDRHTSPFEMVETKWIMRLPVVIWWQFMRHRTWTYMSINSQSGRFKQLSEDLAIDQGTRWRAQSQSNKQAGEGEVELSESLHEAVIANLTESYALYEALLNYGVERGQARMILPFASTYYTMVVKVDLWNLMHLLDLRMKMDAQQEIREVANAIFEVLKQIAPETALAFAVNEKLGERPSPQNWDEAKREIAAEWSLDRSATLLREVSE